MRLRTVPPRPMVRFRHLLHRFELHYLAMDNRREFPERLPHARLDLRMR